MAQSSQRFEPPENSGRFRLRIWQPGVGLGSRRIPAVLTSEEAGDRDVAFAFGKIGAWFIAMICGPAPLGQTDTVSGHLIDAIGDPIQPARDFTE